jgi:pimeloyl-ACP methyl ester carboxylesterase
MQSAATVIVVLLALMLGATGCLYAPDIAAERLERKYAGEPSRFVEVDGLRMHYRDEGQGPPIVLLHGIAANLFLWDAWAERLRDRYRVIRVDLPGHGLTGPDQAGRYGWNDAAVLVGRFLDRIGVGRAALVGSSHGGAVAWNLAASQPERVGALVLMAPVGYPFEGGRPPLIFRLLANPVAGPVLIRLTPRGEFARRARGVYGDPSRLDQATIDQQYDLFRRAGNRDALLTMLRAGSRGGPMPDPRPQLAKIAAPTLLVWGTADKAVPPTQAERFAGDIRGAEVALVQGAGHAPMEELPGESLAPVEAFLRRHPW